MNTQLRDQALPITDRVAQANPWLECDGLSNVLQYYLDQEEALPVTHHRGIVFPGWAYPVNHDWISLGSWIVDYRLRIWYPDEPEEKIPHGIFDGNEFPDITYTTYQLLGVLPKFVIEELEKPRPIPQWTTFARSLKNRYLGIPTTREDAEELLKTLNAAPPVITGDPTRIIASSN
jgi:hypothetical protein